MSLSLMNDPAFARRIDDLTQSSLGNIDNVAATVRLAEYVLLCGVPGSFMECGSGSGAHPAAIAMVLEAFGDRGVSSASHERRVYLCDSFEGIPRPGPNDASYVPLLGPGNGELESTGVVRCPRKAVEDNMKRWGVRTDWLRYVEGWFQNTLPIEAKRMRRDGERFALLRIDANLYESVKVAMQTMAPLLSRGGVLILDDYRHAGSRKAIDDWFISECGDKLPKLLPVSPGDPESAVYCVRDW